MLDRPFAGLFQDGTNIEQVRIERIAEWFASNEIGQLRLPPIQRSLVWSNEQILNYWDSLMRGYPAGMMMVHRANVVAGGKLEGRGADDRTAPMTERDFHLFDGQQRLSAILLGLGKGPLRASHRIWVDLGKKENLAGRLFELRMNSEGQPFGYKPDKPNEKPSIDERRQRGEDWPKTDNLPTPPDVIFEKLGWQTRPTLIKASLPMPLADLLKRLKDGYEVSETDELIRVGADPGIVKEIRDRLRDALNAQVIVSLIDSKLVNKAAEYSRFFERLGQGGTRLSDDELTYSLIKNAYPHVHDRMRDIKAGPDAPGRFTSEVDLVLAALRVSKTMAWEGAKEGEKAERPTPKLIERLQDGEARLEKTKDYFLTLLPQLGEARLLTALRRLREGLLYQTSANPTGLPSMLLARLPRDLVDVLLLFAVKRGETKAFDGKDRQTLIAFVLFWLLFVSNDEKAGHQCFVEAASSNWSFGEATTAALICRLEKEAARPAPRQGDWTLLHSEVANRGQKLANWNDRFKGADSSEATKPGEALRVLSTNSELIRRALMWLQRSYISHKFPNYNPMSTRDDDLPLDLDHAIPQDLFGRHWNDAKSRPQISDVELEAFRWRRGIVGNSLGNYRWLAASDNRGRGKSEIEPEGDTLPVCDDINRTSWNALIGKGDVSRWSGDDVATFQRLIDTRTILLTQKLLDDGGVAELIGVSDLQSKMAAVPDGSYASPPLAFSGACQT